MKQRALRRAEREAEQERLRRARERAQRRRAVLRRLRPRLPQRRRTGRLYARRSRTERIAIVGVGLALLAAVWLWLDWEALRVGLTVLILLVAPALIVLTFDRRI